MKKKLLVLSLIVICVALIAGGTLAYFTAEDTAHNVFTSGGVDIVVEEWQQVPGENDPQPYPENDPIEIMPGDVVSKIPTVKSADEDVWVRVALSIVVKDAEGNDMQLSADEIAQIISLDINTLEWTLKDGYYYYSEAVGADENGNAGVTDELFNTVTFASTMDNKFQHCTVEIDVLAEAVQAKNNGTSALDALWS